jgi:hypothetical protein
MLAVKANKQYCITEEQRAKYLADGYDIANDKGKVIEHCPLKTVSYEEYAALAEKVKSAAKK